MKLLIYILKDYRRVEDLLLALVEAGVTGATYLEGRGMAQLLGDMPIFTGLRGLFPGSAQDSHVVLAAVPAGKAPSCLALMEQVVGPLSQPGNGVAMVVPLDVMMGMAPEIE